MERSLSEDKLLGHDEEFVNIDIRSVDYQKRGKYMKMRQLQEGEQEIDTSETHPANNTEAPEGVITNPNQSTGVEVTVNASDSEVKKELTFTTSGKTPSSENIEGDDGSSGTDYVGVTNPGNNIRAKLIFMVSLVTLVVLAYGLLTLHWLLPYYYAVSAPILILIRIVMYWKHKWQYFLIDFCYFGNALCYAYMWAVPSNGVVFMVMFGLANGPLAWAVWLFRNSLVLHSTDKMTSVFIHVLPPYLTYGIRWYASSISEHWYKPFVTFDTTSWHYEATWLILVPFACFVSHSLTYMVFVYLVIKPGDEYINSYRYLATKSTYAKIINIFGEKFQFLIYHLCYWTYCLISLLFTLLWYRYFIAHTVFIIFMSLVAAWNGATFYMDVFSVRGHAADG